ncbi:MAG: hypothetical protein AAB035_01025 [Nitrospirota bacterium]
MRLLVFLFLFLFFPNDQGVYAEVGSSSPALAEQIVAVVNKQIIFLSDLRRDQLFFGGRPSQGTLPLREETAAIPTSLPSREAVQKRVQHQLLLLEARQFILEPPSEKAIDFEMEMVQKRFQDQTAFEKGLKETDMTLDELRREVLNLLWVKRLLQDRIAFFVFVTDAEIRQYHQQHQSEFEQSGQEINGVEETIRKILEKEKEAIKVKEYLARLAASADIEIYIE